MTDPMSSAFQKTSDTGGNAWVRFAFVRKHTQNAVMGLVMGKALSFPQHLIKIPPGPASACCPIAVEKPPSNEMAVLIQF